MWLPLKYLRSRGLHYSCRIFRRPNAGTGSHHPPPTQKPPAQAALGQFSRSAGTFRSPTNSIRASQTQCMQSFPPSWAPPPPPHHKKTQTHELGTSYLIEAKADGNPTKDQMRLMMQSLPPPPPPPPPPLPPRNHLHHITPLHPKMSAILPTLDDRFKLRSPPPLSLILISPPQEITSPYIPPSTPNSTISPHSTPRISF